MKLIHLSPPGATGFTELPCIYGRKFVPASPVLRGMALCSVILGPGAETRNVPEEKGHYHERMTELYLFTVGSGKVLLNNTWHGVRAGAFVMLPPRVIHTARAGDSGLEFVVLTCPAYNPTDSFDVFDCRGESLPSNPDWVKTLCPAGGGGTLDLEPLFESAACGLEMARLAPGAAIPQHAHDSAEEAYFLLEGKARVHLGGREFDATPGAFVSIPVGTRHGITAGDNGVRYLIAATPPVASRHSAQAPTSVSASQRS